MDLTLLSLSIKVSEFKFEYMSSFFQMALLSSLLCGKLWWRLTVKREWDRTLQTHVHMHTVASYPAPS